MFETLKRWFSSKARQTDLERASAENKKHLSGPEPFRAFAPDPSRDYWPLAVGRDNQQAERQLSHEGVRLVRVSDGSETSLSELHDAAVIFGTVWETYTAETLGRLSRALQARQRPFAVVLFEDSLEDARAGRTSSAWYSSQVYVLHPSDPLRHRIFRVPLTAFTDADGRVVHIHEGLNPPFERLS